MPQRVFRATPAQGWTARLQKLKDSRRTKITALIIIAIFLLFVFSRFSGGPIPHDIQKQLTSTLYVPSSQYGGLVRSSVKYDTTAKVLTFRTTVGTTGATVSEQASPDSFSDIPELYSKLINGLNEYTTFNTTNGTVHLTKPSQQNGNSVAVLNNAGTLLFVRSDNAPSLTQWQQFFNHLKIVN